MHNHISFVKTVTRMLFSRAIAILFLLGFLSESFAQFQDLKFSIPYGNNPSAGKFAQLNGMNMYFEEYGKGQPLLLIHGNGGNILTMGYQVDYFSKNYRCIVADSRGHGKSGLNTSRLTYEQMARDWAALMDHLKLDSALVVGWSDGGILGLLLAIHHPRKVKMLAIMGANLQPDTSAVYPWAVDWVASLDKLIDSMIMRGDTAQNWKLTKQHVDLLGKQPNIPWSDLKKINAPTLVLAGDRDVIREEHTVKIYQQIPKSQLCIFPGETHMIPVSNAELFNKTVEKFFAKPFSRPDTKDFFLR